MKYGVGLNHLPSGKFAANGAWLAVQVIAHNLARWTARLGLGAGIVNAVLVTDQADYGIAGCHGFIGGPPYWDWSIPVATGSLAHLALENMGNLTLSDGAVAYAATPDVVAGCPMTAIGPVSADTGSESRFWCLCTVSPPPRYVLGLRHAEQALTMAGSARVASLTQHPSRGGARRHQ